MPQSHLERLDPEAVDAFGQQLDVLYEQVKADLGDDDRRYIRRIIRLQRSLALGGRLVIFASLALLPRWEHAWASWPAFLSVIALGTLSLAVAKILENMEIGHNVMHGQWDWMRDPDIHSSTWEWDTACPSDQWRHSHNVMHHTWTNVIGKDRDLGYGILRMDESTPWRPRHLAQPLSNALLALLFEYGVALHDLEVERIESGERTWAEAWPLLRRILRKIGRQVLKDYVLWPLLAGPLFLYVAAANATANLLRNLWSYMIIFCGHFPAGAHVFPARVVEGESRGQWYLRQLLGSCNLEGGKLFHILSGNLSHQIEHHLFPDLPSNRYPEIAPRVRALCARHGLPYNTGSLTRQFGSTLWKITRLSLPSSPRAVHVPS